MIAREKIIEWLSQTQKNGKKRGKNMGKFEKDGRSILKKAYIEGSKRSRFDDKKEGVDNKFIYADVNFL